MLLRKVTILRTMAAFAGAAAVIGLSAGPALGSTQGLNYEVDNGFSWTLANGPSSLAQPVQTGYADAGVVADIGPAAGFTGITDTGSANLAANIWIADGTEATQPGTHPLSGKVDFSYGFRNAEGEYWMASGPYVNQTLTAAQIRQDFAGDEAYAWVGIVYTGTPVSGYVSSINGINTSHRNLSIQPNDQGTLIVAVR